jgi:hypothetical protein
VIYVLDRYAARPGRVEELRSGFEARYLPAARRRGLTLEGLWISPPLELPEQGNELFVLWSLPDEKAFWQMRFASGEDPEVLAWWRDADALVTSRERKFLSPAQARP